MKNSEIERNYDYFEKNIEELIDKYQNDYLVIKDQKVVFNSKEKDKAFDYVKDKYKPGEYIIQKCEKPYDSVQIFYSRVN